MSLRTVLGALLATTLGAGALVATATPAGASALAMRGADVSTLQRATDLGARYHTAAGARAHPLDILPGAGVDYIRLTAVKSSPTGIRPSPGRKIQRPASGLAAANMP